MFQHTISSTLFQLLLLLLIGLSIPSYADITRPDSHGPIGVMGDHAHKLGEWMLSYRYVDMTMDENRIGQQTVSTADVLRDYPVAPLEMTMNMHMFGVMYGVHDDFTVMAMLPYIEKNMLHQTRMGQHFTTNTAGIGDIKLSGLYNLHQHHTAQYSQNIVLGFGLSLPTGAIDKRGNTPAGNRQKLPYPMQLGSGTVDPMLQISYLRQYETWSWGTQFGTVLRFGRNDEGYSLGNTYYGNAWIARVLHPNASISLRIAGKQWHNIHGQDSELNPMMIPTARTDLRAGKRIDFLVGLNLYQTKGRLTGHRIAIEVGTPIYQHLRGPQLKTNYHLTLGWQMAF